MSMHASNNYWQEFMEGFCGWIDLVPIDVDLIAKITGLPTDGVKPESI
jgi:hypothetical protein